VFSNSWIVKADIKFKYYSSVPTFRRKDTAIINFLIYDNKKTYDISSFSKGEVTITFPQGGYIKRPCQKVNINGVDYIQHIFNKDEIVELGVYKVILSFEDNTGRVSLQEILVGFFDTIGTSELAYIELIQDLQNQSDYLESIVNDIIQKNKKGVANGIAKLNSDGKIDISHMPSFLENHTKDSVFKNWVHGLYIDENFVAKYRTKDGGEEYVGHPDLNDKLRLSVTTSNGIANLKFYGGGAVTVRSYIYGDKSLQEVKADGTSFTTDSFPVDKIGVWAIYYKDDGGNEYIYKFAVTTENLKDPDTKITISSGKVTVLNDTPIFFSKYAKGHFDITYFRNSGTLFTDSFLVTEAGEFTIYLKFADGREKIYFLTVREEDLDRVNNAPPTINFTLTPNNQTWTNSDKELTIVIIDSNKITDKRYYFCADSDTSATNKTIQDFRTNLNLGTKMTTNTYSAVIKENGIMFVYAKDEFGNDVMKDLYITSIDKVGAYDCEYSDSFNPVTNKYEINARILSTQAIKEIKYPHGSTLIDESDDYVLYEISSLTKHNIIVTDVLGNSVTFSITPRGKIIDALGENNKFVVFENGDVYVSSYYSNTKGWMGLPENVNVVPYKFYKVPFTEKIKRMFRNGTGGAALSETGNTYVWGQAWDVGFGFKYPYGTILWQPTLYEDSTYAIDANFTSWNYYFKKSDSKWYGVGDTSSTFGNSTEDKVVTPVQLAKNLSYTRYEGTSSRSFFYGTDGKLYACGWNDNSALGVPFSYPYVFSTPKEASLINAKGTVIKVMAQDDSNSYFYMTDGKIYGIGGALFWGTKAGTIQATTGYPTNDPPVDFIYWGQDQALLSTNGNVYVNGSNNGTLGIGNKNTIPSSQFVKLQIGRKVKKITFDTNGSVLRLITEKGEVLESDPDTGLLKDTTEDYSFLIKATKL